MRRSRRAGRHRLRTRNRSIRRICCQSTGRTSGSRRNNRRIGKTNFGCRRCNPMNRRLADIDCRRMMIRPGTSNSKPTWVGSRAKIAPTTTIIQPKARVMARMTRRPGVSGGVTGIKHPYGGPGRRRKAPTPLYFRRTPDVSGRQVGFVPQSGFAGGEGFVEAA